MDSSPKVLQSRKSAHFNRWSRGAIVSVVFVILVLVALCLALLKLPNPPKVEWLGPRSFANQSKGPLAAMKRGMFKLPVVGTWWRRYQARKPKVWLSSSLLMISTNDWEHITLGPPTSINTNGVRAWVLSAAELKAFQPSLTYLLASTRSLPPPMRLGIDGMNIQNMRIIQPPQIAMIAPPRMVRQTSPIGPNPMPPRTLDELHAIVSSQVPFPPAQINGMIPPPRFTAPFSAPIPTKFLLDCVPESLPSSVKLSLRLTMSYLITPPAGTPPVNFAPACRATIPNNGALVIDGGPARDPYGRDYFVVITAQTWDGNPPPVIMAPVLQSYEMQLPAKP
jgi:hypothetical protein